MSWPAASSHLSTSARIGSRQGSNAYNAFTVAASGDLTGVGAVRRAPAPMVYRLRTDGAVDERFGGTGQVITRFDDYQAQNTGYYTFALLPADRITAAGTVCREPSVCDVVVARYGDVEP